MEPAGSFHEMVKPQVYREMHRMTRQLLHMDMKQLQGGELFPDVMKRFLSWLRGSRGGQPAGKRDLSGRDGCRGEGIARRTERQRMERGESRGGAEQSAAGSACAVPVRHLGAAGSDGAAAEHAFLRHGACGERAGKIL